MTDENQQRLLDKLDTLGRVDDMPRPFGPYVLLASLARGGMGEVFLARSGGIAGLEKHCVIKTLRPQFTDDQEYVSRFVDEARIVVRLGHRNICQVFDVGTVSERFYLAMEHIAGKDLRAVEQRLKESGGRFDDGLAVHVLSEVLEALDYAHRHEDHAGNPMNLVHRDISPQNVMVSYEGEVKLIDFGLAASTLKVEQTSPNVVMGKLAYMSPEQVRGEKLDARADLFACAVMAYELLTGERYYEGKSPFEIWSIAGTGTFRPRKWNELEPILRVVLDKALAGDRERRHATCEALREDLQAWRRGQSVHGDAPALRKVMREAFLEEQRAFKEQLRELSSSKVLANRAPVPAAENTQSIARASGADLDAPTIDDLRVSQPEARSVAPPSAAAVETAITEPTAAIARALAEPKRGRAAAVAAVALVAVVVIVGGVVLSRPPSPVPVPVQPVAVLTTATSEPRPLLPAPPTLDVAPVVDPLPPPPEPPTIVAPPKSVRPARPKAASTARAAPPATARPLRPLAVAPRPWDDMTKRQRLDAITQLCPGLPCIADLGPRLPTFGAADMQAITDDLNACRAACGKL